MTAGSGGFPDDGAGVQFGNLLREAVLITLSVPRDQVLWMLMSIKVNVDVLHSGAARVRGSLSGRNSGLELSNSVSNGG